MVFHVDDHLFTGFWAISGSILGFYAFRRNPNMNFISIIGHCFLSIGIGLLVAFPITEYLHEIEHFPKRLSMMLGAIGAFGLPDFILRHYQKVSTRVADKIINEGVNTKNTTNDPLERR